MSTTPPRFYAGTTGWAYDSWVGPFYPDGTKSSEYLGHYAKHFRAVEIDATFYRIPQPASIAAWATHTPDDFTFTAKFPKAITHDKRLQDCEDEARAFVGTMGELGSKLGPLVLQFDYTFQAEQQSALEAFLDQLPKNRRYAVEVRHRSWLKCAFYDMLRERSVALVLPDLPYMPRQDLATTNWVYIRLLGSREQAEGDLDPLVAKRSEDLTWWAQRISWHLDAGRDVYVFATDFYAGHAPATIQALVRKLEGMRRSLE